MLGAAVAPAAAAAAAASLAFSSLLLWAGPPPRPPKLRRGLATLARCTAPHAEVAKGDQFVATKMKLSVYGKGATCSCESSAQATNRVEPNAAAPRSCCRYRALHHLCRELRNSTRSVSWNMTSRTWPRPVWMSIRGFKAGAQMMGVEDLDRVGRERVVPSLLPGSLQGQGRLAVPLQLALVHLHVLAQPALLRHICRHRQCSQWPSSLTPGTPLPIDTSECASAAGALDILLHHIVKPSIGLWSMFRLCSPSAAGARPLGQDAKCAHQQGRQALLGVDTDAWRAFCMATEAAVWRM